MSDLIEKVKLAKIRAAENTVIKFLEEKMEPVAIKTLHKAVEPPALYKVVVMDGILGPEFEIYQDGQVAMNRAQEIAKLLADSPDDIVEEDIGHLLAIKYSSQGDYVIVDPILLGREYI